MKRFLLIIILLGSSQLLLNAQWKPFRGSFYVGAEAGLFTSRTKMVSGELGKYRTGVSGMMPMYAYKIGYSFNPYFSIETGLHSYPMTLVYLYGDDKSWFPTTIGASSMKFKGTPLRAVGRIYVLNKAIESTISAGFGLIDANYLPDIKSFQGTQKIGKDSIAYFGETSILRKNAAYGELGVGINWAITRRWKLSLHARQLVGMLSIAKVNVAIKQNHSPANQAQFVGKGSGLNVGFGLQYQFRLGNKER